MTKIQIQIGFDEKVLEGCIAGRPHYQKLLYNHFSPTMFGICLRYANDYHQAEDILQEGFIKVFNNLHRFRKEGSFEGWMKRIFINTAIEYYRKSFNFCALTVIDEWRNRSKGNAGFQNLATQDLLKLVQKLPPGYRTVFNLYAIEGYAHREIAEMLQISEGTSKSQLARARNTLKGMIKQQDQNEGI